MRGGEGEILIGQFGSLGGPDKPFGKSMRNGIMLALDEINEAGGVNRRRIRAITHDDSSKPAQAAESVGTLILENQVIALLGGSRSATTLAAAPIAQANAVPMIAPAAPSDRVNEAGDYIFRIAASDARQGEALGGYAGRTLALRRAAILLDGASDSSAALAAGFERAFTNSGGSIVAKQTYPSAGTDFARQLEPIAAARPDLLVVPASYEIVAKIARQVRAAGIAAPLAGGDGWDAARLIETAGSALDGSFFVTHYHAGAPAPAVQKFVERYKQVYGAQPDAWAALGYDSAYVLADAIRRAGSIAGPAIRDAIAATRDVRGVTGSITIGPDRAAVARPLFIVEIRGGQRVLKARLEPAVPEIQ